MAVQIQIRRGTAAAWTSANPTLAAGEFAIETDTDFYKIGDGSTAWTSLGYSSLPSTAISNTVVDAKGDIIAATADNTVAKLTVGSNGQVLTAASGQGTGLQWATMTHTAITVADTTDTTCFVGLFESATGDLGPKTDAGVTYNAGTGMLTATGFTGPLTGNASGSSGSTTGNAATATALATARTIGGTSFDGTGNIAVGLAATATALATARTIGGTSFDGTGNIAVGLAATATALATARTIGGVSFDGTANVAVTSAFTFSKVGDLTVAAGKGRLKVPMAITIVDVTATCNTAPTGAAALFDVNKGGTTIFSTQGNRPTVAAGSQDGAAATPDVTAVAAGDVLTVDIDQIGSSTVGADATVVIRYTTA